MDQWAFFDEVKAGTVRNAYLFYGPEAYIRKSALTTLQKKLLTPGLEDMNCTFMQNPTAQQIVENCETLPMLGDWRLVIVQGLALLESGKAKDEAQESKTLVDYIGRVPPSTCLVFECEAPDKRKKLCQTLMKLSGAVSFDALSDARLTQWMNQTLRPMKKRMDANTCAHLAFTSGRDLTMLNGELQKLAAYVGERETITAEDVEQIATHTAECTVFAMVDALVDGQAERAFSLLNVLLESGEQRIGVLALITRQYRQMLYAKDMQESRTPQAQMAKALGAEKSIIAVEDNKPEAVEALKAEAGDDPLIEIRVLPTRYPQGAKKQLILAVTGKEVAPGARTGALFNVTTVYSICRAVYEGLPITEKVVTVTGEGAVEPKNMIVRVGTPIGELLEAAGGVKEETCKVICGGPMMGTAQGDLSVPVVKGTNAVLCMVDAAPAAEDPTCIRCGKCVTVCPHNALKLDVTLKGKRRRGTRQEDADA